MDDFDLELKQDFILEAKESLANIEQDFLQLEDRPEDEEILNAIFRVAHNIKGAGRAVGFAAIAEFAHKVENLILKLKQKEVVASSAVISLLLDCIDKINEMLDGLGEDVDATFDTESLEANLLKAIAGEMTDTAANTETAGSDVAPEKIESNEETQASPEQFQKEAKWSAEDKAPKSKPKPKKASKGKDEESIRVALAKIEDLNNLVGELIIQQSVLQQSVFLDKKQTSMRSIGHLSKIAKELQSISMNIRMLPVKGIFNKMTRIVRDTSKTLGKDIKLEIRGEETEVDKPVLDRLGDPLVHIIRNSIDHGIEMPDDREANGKPRQGIVNLSAYHQGNFLVIEIKDNGKGIDAEKVYQKAVASGTIPKDKVLSSEEKLELIFHPGLSTKEKVSEVSGRGVGMDVVRTNIEELGGNVKLESELGKGSTIRINLPLTIAILDGMVVDVGSDKFVIPLEQIQESLRVTPEMYTKRSDIGEVITLRGDVIPVYNLAESLKCHHYQRSALERTIIISENKGRKFAVWTDDILFQQQVVIKKLGSEIRNQKGLIGGSILGDGMPTFIVDIRELFADQMKSRTIQASA